MIRIAITALALTALGAAQVQVFGGTETERCATTKFAFEQSGGNFKMLAGACIQYSAPTWKPEYDSMAEKAKGQSFRLGKNYWTTLNTTGLTIGGVNVPNGAYYLALRCDDKGAFQLLVLDAKNADSKLWSPMASTEWKAEYTCPLQHAKGKASVDKLAITLEGDDPTALELKIAWGGHELTAPVQMNNVNAANAKDAGSDKAKSAPADLKKSEAGKK